MRILCELGFLFSLLLLCAVDLCLADEVFSGGGTHLCTVAECQGQSVTFTANQEFHFRADEDSACLNSEMAIQSGCTWSSSGFECDQEGEGCRDSSLTVHNSDLMTNGGYLDCYELNVANQNVCRDMEITLNNSRMELMCEVNDCQNMNIYLHGTSHLEIRAGSTLPATDRITIYQYGPDTTIEDNSRVPYNLVTPQPTDMPTTSNPTQSTSLPSLMPTNEPSFTNDPSVSPTFGTANPTGAPSHLTDNPTTQPTPQMTPSPSSLPTVLASDTDTNAPSLTESPTMNPNMDENDEVNTGSKGSGNGETQPWVYAVLAGFGFLCLMLVGLVYFKWIHPRSKENTQPAKVAELGSTEGMMHITVQPQAVPAHSPRMEFIDGEDDEKAAEYQTAGMDAGESSEEKESEE